CPVLDEFDKLCPYPVQGFGSDSPSHRLDRLHGTATSPSDGIPSSSCSAAPMAPTPTATCGCLILEIPWGCTVRRIPPAPASDMPAVQHQLPIIVMALCAESNEWYRFPAGTIAPSARAFCSAVVASNPSRWILHAGALYSASKT